MQFFCFGANFYPIFEGVFHTFKNQCKIRLSCGHCSIRNKKLPITALKSVFGDGIKQKPKYLTKIS